MGPLEPILAPGEVPVEAVLLVLGVVYSGLCLILLGFVGRAELFLFLVLPKPSHDAAELSMQHVRLGPVWGIPNMGNMASHEPPCIRA